MPFPASGAPPRSGFKQFVFLVVTGVGVGFVVFLLGVFVGRGAAPWDPAAGAGPLALDEAAPAGGGSGGAAAGAGLSYGRRLGGASGDDPDAGLVRRAAEIGRPAAGGAVVPAPGIAVGAAAAGGYAVQVMTLRERGAADRMAAWLVGKGYPAFVADPAAGAPVALFRVRVGPYADRGAAAAVRQRLEREESLRPWITQ